MRITKHPIDEEGLIHIPHCVRLLTMGLQENVVTIWAVTDDTQGMYMSFAVKEDGAVMTPGDCKRYITSFISGTGPGVWHLIADEQKVVPASIQPPHPGTHNPNGKILL